MAKKPVLNAVSYTNSIGQVINPGDEVVIFTQGYNHSVNTKKGVYLGLKGKGCSCRVTEKHTKYRHKETGEEVGFYYNDDYKARYNDSNEWPRPPSGFRYGTPEYQQAYEVYRKEYDAWQVKQQKIQELYEQFEVPYFRHTTLQLNRIYKIDTSLADSAKL